MTTWVVRAGILILAMQVGSMAAAADIKLGPVRTESVEVETVYQFRARDYLPPAVFEPKRIADPATPEDALIGYVAAMAALDYEGALASWTESSREFMRQDHRAKEITPEVLKTAWAATFKGKKVELVRRVETGAFVILFYRPVLEPGGNDKLLKVALIKEGAVWRLTQDLRDDPVFTVAPGEKPRRVMRTPDQGPGR